MEVNDRSGDNCRLTEETALMRTVDQLPRISIPAIRGGSDDGGDYTNDSCI